MKKSKFFTGLFLITALVSCSKQDRGNMTQLFTPDGQLVSTFSTKNNGGNVTCDEVAAANGCSFENTSGRIDYNGGDGGTIGPITWTTDGTYINWSSTVPVKFAIIVKGGPNASVYSSGCDDFEMSGTALSAPINPNNGKPYGLSNITFCYSKLPFIVAMKSFITYGNSGFACTLGGGSYYIGYQDFISGSSYPLYFNGQISSPIGTLQLGDFDNDNLMEVKITSNNPDLKFRMPYLYVGPVEGFNASYLDYPYPLVKAAIDPPALEVIFDLPF